MDEKTFQKYLQKGDSAFDKGKFKAALKYYEKALDINSENISLYAKLIQTHQSLNQDWTEEDFAISLAWSMKKQELEDPKFKRIHAQLEPESQEVTKLIQQMILAKNETLETSLIEKIISFQEQALYPLVEALLTYKKALPQGQMNPDDEEE